MIDKGRFLSRLLIAGLILGLSSTISLAETKFKGEYELIDEPSLHQPGKVILLEFADFYCPHCHMFEKVVVKKLKREFGDQLEDRLVGFPVIRGKLPTAFEMYEQANAMGKGPDMKHALFRSIHDNNIQVFDKSIRAVLIKDVGLDAQAFEKGMASGVPFRKFEEGKSWGQRIGVSHTPTVILDGNIRVDKLTKENLKTVIQSILDNDTTS